MAVWFAGMIVAVFAATFTVLNLIEPKLIYNLWQEDSYAIAKSGTPNLLFNDLKMSIGTLKVQI